LDWSTFDREKIAVQLKDTDGLAEGRVTIKASTLQRIHPALLPKQLEEEYLLPISLKTVVLQVQTLLREGSEEALKAVEPDFDTPIAQVAREDEGFFKLARAAETKESPITETVPAKRKISGPVLTPADRPASAMLRVKSPTENRAPGSPLRVTAMGLAPPQSAIPADELGKTEGDHPKIRDDGQNSLERMALERLREIFMTEEQLDVRQVANLLVAFPKVNSALIMDGTGKVLAGNLPEGYHLETALLTPVIMRSVWDFNRRLRSKETSALTLLGERPITLFGEGNLYILISHEGRGLLPGVRERIAEVARALDSLCRQCPGAKS
jgi:hypothetical protein